MTSHLVFRSNQGHISYRLRDKRRFTSKMASFPHPRLFNALAEGVAPWNFVTAAKVMPLPDGGKSLICAFVSIQYQSVTDRRTDGFATTISRSACLRTPKRDKNSRTDACFSCTKTKTRTTYCKKHRNELKCFSSCNLFQARLTENKFRPASAFTLFCVEVQMLHHHQSYRSLNS